MEQIIFMDGLKATKHRRMEYWRKTQKSIEGFCIISVDLQNFFKDNLNVKTYCQTHILNKYILKWN